MKKRPSTCHTLLHLLQTGNIDQKDTFMEEKYDFILCILYIWDKNNMSVLNMWFNRTHIQIPYNFDHHRTVYIILYRSIRF